MVCLCTINLTKKQYKLTIKQIFNLTWCVHSQYHSNYLKYQHISMYVSVSLAARLSLPKDFKRKPWHSWHDHRTLRANTNALYLDEVFSSDILRQYDVLNVAFSRVALTTHQCCGWLLTCVCHSGMIYVNVWRAGISTH